MTKENKGVTIYFVRHGQTFLNFYGRMQGWADAPLTPRGIEDIRKSGYGMRDVKFDAVYSSDLRRTERTAEILLEKNEATDPDIEITPMREFREVSFGSFEGEFGKVAFQKIADHLGYSTIEEMFENTKLPERMNAFKAADEYHDAENFMTFWLRVERGLIEVINKHRDTGDTILIVAHGGTIRHLLTSLIPDLENPESLLNASVSIADYHSGQFHLHAYGQTSHFMEYDEFQYE